MDKKTILEEFIQINQGFAKQGTTQWLNDKKYIIGGSEMAVMANCNRFVNKCELIAQKVGIDPFMGNTATRWGNLFENVSELLFETIFLNNKKIYSTGSIPHKNVKNHRYSPDGLCILPFSNNDGVLTDKVALIEFKSPYRSIPTDKIPEYYLPQVRAGLCTINIAETAVFVNNMFKKCSLKQLNFSTEYDNSYHKNTDKSLTGINTAIANGIVLFYISKDDIHTFMQKYDDMILKRRNTKPSELKKFILDIMSDDDDDYVENEHNMHDDGTNILYKIYKNIKLFNDGVLNKSDALANMIDIGDESVTMFDQFLELYKPNEQSDTFISIRCIKPQINKKIFADKSVKNLIIPSELDYVRDKKYTDHICKKYDMLKIIDGFVDLSLKSDNIPIGYLPWKLLKASNIIVERVDKYVDSLEHEIDDTIDKIKNINMCGTVREKVSKLDEYFKDNNISKKYFEANHSIDLIKEFIDD